MVKLLNKPGSKLPGLATALAVSLLGANAEAQLYTLNQYSAPFVPLAAGTSVNAQFPSQDDGAITVPLGFSFSYFGQTFTHVNIAVNGFLWLADPCAGGCPAGDVCDASLNVCGSDFASTAAPSPVPFPVSGSPDALVAAYWDDLIITSAAPASSILTQLTGGAPNRTFTVEWRNIKHFSGLGGTATFQIRLQESGLIQIHYGATTGSDSTFAGNIGFEDPTGTQALIPNIPCAGTDPFGAGGCSFAELSALADTVIEVGRVQGPELTGSIHPPPGGDAGAQIRINVRARNIGTQTTTSGYAADVYWSVDQNITPADTLLGRLNFPVTAANQTRSATLTANVPAGVAPGRYYIGAILDPANVVPESIQQNNFLVSAPFLVGPDLIVASVRTEDESGPGEILPVSVTIDSVGSPVSTAVYALYFSQNQALDAGDVQVATGTVTIGGAPQVVAVLDALVPANLVPGAYYVIAQIDAPNRIVEVDEANNVAVSMEATAVIGPDIVAVEVSGEPAAFRGEAYRVRATIRNEGGTTAPVVYYSFHLSENQLITISDPLLGEIGPISLAPGQTVQVEHLLPVSSTIAAGNYFLGLITDSTSLVLEELENNNIKRQQTPVVVRDPAPDLTVSNILLPAAGAAGESLIIERTLENVGNASATFTYSIYLTTDTTVDAAVDLRIGQGTVTLGRLEQDIGVDRALLPSSLPAGLYYVAFVIDEADQVEELSEQNNLALSNGSIPIEAGQLMILTRGLPPATVGLPYEVHLAARGGTGAYVWSLSAGGLPPGLSLDPTTGRITGMPQREGQFELRVAVDDGSQIAELPLLLIVGEPTIALEIITRSVPPAFVGRPFELPLTAIGGVPPYVWTASGMIPPGLMLSEDGLLSGVATAPANASVTFQVRDAVGNSHDRVITLRAVTPDDALRFSNDVLRDAVVGKSYEDKLRAENGDPPYEFVLSSGELPPGIRIEGDQVIGVPTQVGEYTFAVRVSDVRGDFDVNRFTLSVEADEGVKFVTNALPAGFVGRPYEGEGSAVVRIIAVTTATGTGVTFEVIDGTLPPGITVSEQGQVTGQPTAAGTYPFTVQARDGAGQTDFRALSIVVLEPEVEPEPTPEEDGCGCNAAQRGESAGWLSLFVLGALLATRRALRGSIAAVLLVAVSVGLSSQAAAQTPYFFQEFDEPYVERTGGTVLTFSSQDDGDATVMLPFPFRYFENDYTTLRVGTNGLASFGPSATSLGNSTFPDSSTPNDVIALYWDDLHSPVGSVHVEGTAPTRVVIVQWQNVHHFGNRTAAANFQLWLYEGGAGRFELRYGPATGLGSGDFDASVGFENSAGSQGHTFLACTPNCGEADLTALDGHVFRALQDAGEDVIAGSITAPARVFAGTPITLSSVLQSFHQNPLGPFRYTIHLVPLGQQQPNNPIFTSGPITLTPYQVLTTQDTVSFDVATPPGRYRVALVADSQNQIMEPDETNNVVWSGELVIGERRPDLVVPAFSVTPLMAEPGDQLSFTAPLRNAGNLDAPEFEWRVVLSANRVVTADDRTIHTARISLPLLTTTTVAVQARLPNDLLPGRYHVGIVVDPDNEVRELSEVNNSGGSTDPVQVGVDFLEISTESLPGGYVGVEYSAFLSAAGGDGTHRWELASGMLPRGLTLLSNSGEIRGTPQAAGDAAITLRVTSGTRMATKDLVVRIDELGGALTIVSRELLPGVVGQSYPPLASGEQPGQGQRLRVVNATGTVTFSLLGDAPPGLMLEDDGYLHGIPVQRGVFDVGVSATDGTSTATRTIVLTVVEPGRLSLIAALLPEAIIEEEYRYQLQAVGKTDTATLTFRLGAEDVLPDGLALTDSGLIVGVPQRLGTWRFAVTVSEGGGPAAPQDTANFTLTVVSNAGFGITPSSLPIATVGEPYDATLEARGGTAPFTWRLVIDGQLPRGLRFEVQDAGGREKLRFLGTPEAIPEDRGGATPFVVTVEDVLGRQAMAPMALRVVEPPAPPPPPVEEGGCSCSATPSGTRSSLAGLGLLLMALFFARRWGGDLR